MDRLKGKTGNHLRKRYFFLFNQPEMILSVFLYFHNKVFFSLLDVNQHWLHLSGVLSFLEVFLITTVSQFLFNLSEGFSFLFVECVVLCRFVSRSIPRHRLLKKQGVNINKHETLYSSTTSSGWKSLWVSPVLMPKAILMSVCLC